MPINITTKQLLTSQKSLRDLSDMSVPVRTALKARKILKVAQAEIETAQEQMKKLVEKHTKTRTITADDGTTVEVSVHPIDQHGNVDENAVELKDVAAYEADVKAVMDAEVVLPFERIKVGDLSDPKDPPLKIKTGILVDLDWLLED